MVPSSLFAYYHSRMARRNPATSELECKSCGSDAVIEIDLTLPDGTEVTFNSCHKCEARWWKQDGRNLDLDVVLDLASKPRS